MEEKSLIFDETPARLLVQASSGKRLANYLIDQVCFYLFFFIIAFVWLYTAGGLGDEVAESPVANILERIAALLGYAFFMGAVEALMKGKSIGKLITGTRAVNEDGSRINARTAFLRGLSRAVPFCAFSALNTPCYPWQDRWTKTYVIDEKLSSLQDNLIDDQAPETYV